MILNIKNKSLCAPLSFYISNYFLFPYNDVKIHISSSYGSSVKENLGSLKLDVEKIALTEKNQRKKLSVILEVVAKCLQLEESQLKWSVECRCRSEIEEKLSIIGFLCYKAAVRQRAARTANKQPVFNY